MLEFILSIGLIIELIIIIQFIRDNKSQNYLIKSLRKTNNQLFGGLIKYKGE
ncbi:MAG: hypothetical protein A4E25_00089 [Methanobacterium sp. PtaB.Bin024]|nr:MAG: hypothetical protein A4E25_00089 [Methanobacterium sp. PtaB.Bin024]